MSAGTEAERPTRRPPEIRTTTVRRTALRHSVRRHLRRENRVLIWLIVMILAATGVAVAWPAVVPLSILVLPLLVGSLLLGPRQLPWYVVFLMVMLMVAIATNQDRINPRTVVTIAVLFLLCFIVLVTSFRRSSLGVAGVLGESMLVDLRDRILNQGGIPKLPNEWLVETALRSAGGTPFAGDFVVATRLRRSTRVEIAVVDVSGKGEEAGTRALLLSGAFGGLLGALPPEEFLPAANDYLLRQDWDEGFATAIHLSLDTRTGEFEIRTAGHPPAAKLDAGSGRWSIHEAEGPVLGLLEDAEFTTVRGVLRRGDALLLYTDGMVETPRRDIGLGIDRLLGQAERLLGGVFDGGADRLVDTLGAENDDRALVVVHHR